MAVLSEITEAEAEGRVAEIFEEIRQVYAAPYVSSLFRHLATYPGLLEWIWEITRPAFLAGAVQHTGWRHVDVSALAPLPAVPRPALRALGVDAEAEKVIGDVCRTFTRVSPINLVFAGCLRQLLTDATLVTSGAATVPETLPPALPRLPAMVAWDALTPDHRAVLDIFETDLAGKPFVPGLYRILAHWPAYLAHVAVLLGPRLADAEVLEECERIADRIVDTAPEVLATLALPGGPPPLDPEQRKRVLSAIATYRGTSPQMVGFGTLLLDALPRS